MKKTMKKALAIILTLLMIATTVPFALASEDTVINSMAELQTALDNGGEYELGNDIVMTTSAYQTNDVTTVIDMNGYEIGDTPWGVAVFDGELTMYGGTFTQVVPEVRGGTFTIKDVTIDAISSMATGISEGKFVLENVTLNGPYSCGVYATGGETIIIGGTYSCSDYDIIKYYDTIPDVKIYGGTFSKSVADYVADGYSETEVEGLYVVESNRKGTAGDNITWVVDYYGTLRLSGTGALPYLWATDTAWSEYNDVIKSIVVGEGITSAEGTAFYGAVYAETLYLPSTLTYIESYVFGGDYIALKEIIVAEENTTYKSIDGVLFTEDETTIVCYPPSKEGAEYTIPSSVTTISDEAFICNQTLEKIVIPDTVTNIENYSFAYSEAKSIEVGNGVTTLSYRCFSSTKAEKLIVSDSVKVIEEYVFEDMFYLETLVLGSGIETIGEDILTNTRELRAVHYHGTQEDWDKITIDEQSYEGYSFEDKELHFVAEKEGFDATCGAEGHASGLYCAECDEYFTGDVIAATGEHTYDDGVVTPPTCAEQGYTTYTCGECGDTYTDDETDALGHNFVDGTCDVCGESCEHVDTDADEICDECGASVPMDEATVGETETAKIPEEGEYCVKFTPDETGYYVIESFEDEYDPKVYLYDADGDEIDDNDDGGVDYNFRLVFEATAGETYYFIMTEYDDYEAEIEYSINKYYCITHQPTVLEPYVEISWDSNAEYQWYTVTAGTEITDENASVCAYYNASSSYYDEAGWHGNYWDDNGAYFFEIELKKGDVIIAEFSDVIKNEIGIWESSENTGSYTYCTDNNGLVAFVAPFDGTFELYAYGLKSDTVVKAYLGNCVAIDGETTNTLENGEFGEMYFCKATRENGDVLESDVFKYAYEITHQPTADEPYVELNDDTDATYQWYTVSIGDEITDENATGREADEGYFSTYSADSGWSAAPYIGYDDSNFFMIDLEEGDTITMIIDEDVEEFGIWSYDANSRYLYEVEANEPCVFTATGDDTFYVYAYCSTEAKVRAYFGEYEYEAIEGATDAIYPATEDGLYSCQVTFADDTVEMSDIFEGPHAHNYEAEVTAPTCTEQGYTTYTCTGCGDSYTADYADATGHEYENGSCGECGQADPDYNPDAPEAEYTFSILEPSRTEIRNKDGILLHAIIDGTAPDGAYVEWTADNNKFSTEVIDDDTLQIIAKNKGYTVFTATLYDADGNVLAEDSVEMYSDSGFFAKIGGFFRSLFGGTTIYES